MSDLISRQEAIKAIDDLPNCYNGYSDTYDKSLIIGVIEELPAAKPKKGKWMLHDGYYCGVCGYKLLTTAIPDRCPSCMAYMRGVEA